MARPSLLQTLLQRPSQSYAARPDEHSGPRPRPPRPDPGPQHTENPTDPADSSESSDGEDVFYTPDSSPRQSVDVAASLLSTSASASASDADLFAFSASSSPSTRPTSPTPSTLSSRPRSKRKARRRVRQPMTALLEEDEDSQSAVSRQFRRTVEVPAPLPLLGASAPAGFNHLVLAKAAYTPAAHVDILSHKIDLITAGIAQTTMCSIEISLNAAAELAAKRSFRPRRLGSAQHWTTTSQSRRSRANSLSFVSHLEPPSKLGVNQALVQIWAVGLDSIDGLIVSRKLRTSSHAGFVPGRSFVGRVLEAGFRVNSVAKGEWVYGLTDVQTCGALSEFLLIDKRRLHRAPRPSPSLPLENIALLPLSGISSHRAVTCLIPVRSSKRPVLVLQCHQGAGALASQELRARGFAVVGQVPDENAKELAYSSGSSVTHSGFPLSVMANLPSSEFSAVLDTVGGKQIWEASHRILMNGGQFVTLLGDSNDGVIPSARDMLKSNWRSLRQTFVRRDRKTLGYWRIPATSQLDHTGQDISGTLAVVTEMVEAGVLRPICSNSVTLEHTPDVFPGAVEVGGLCEGAVVVRVVR